MISQPEMDIQRVGKKTFSFREKWSCGKADDIATANIHRAIARIIRL